MSKKKNVSRNVARKAVNKRTRKVSDKVRGDECPDNVCPIDKKKKNSKKSNKSCCNDSKSLFGSVLDFIFPSRLK